MRRCIWINVCVLFALLSCRPPLGQGNVQSSEKGGLPLEDLDDHFVERIKTKGTQICPTLDRTICYNEKDHFLKDVALSKRLFYVTTDSEYYKTLTHQAKKQNSVKNNVSCCQKAGGIPLTAYYWQGLVRKKIYSAYIGCDLPIVGDHLEILRGNNRGVSSPQMFVRQQLEIQLKNSCS